jgi:hypothetical protein
MDGDIVNSNQRRHSLTSVCGGPQVGEGRGGVAGERATVGCPSDPHPWSYYDPGEGGFLPHSDIRQAVDREQLTTCVFVLLISRNNIFRQKVINAKI